MRYIVLILILLVTGQVKSQKRDFYINYPVTFSKDKGFLPLNYDDSMWIEELAFEDTVSRCHVTKLSNLDLIIAYKLPKYDLIYIVESDKVTRIYEVGHKHFWYIRLKEQQEILRK